MIGLISIALVFGFITGLIIAKINFKKRLSKGTGRMGIIKVDDYSSKGIIEIEEVSTTVIINGDSMTKIIIHHVSTPEIYKKEDVLSSLSSRVWVSTKRIYWYNDNDQRIRDRKLSEILK